MNKKVTILLLQSDNEFLRNQIQLKNALISRQRKTNSEFLKQRDSNQERIIQLENSNVDMARQKQILTKANELFSAVDAQRNMLLTENKELKIEFDVCSKALKSAENALNYKEIREIDNAEFASKILMAIINEKK